MIVIGHGPAPEVGPYVPDYLVARSDDGKEVVLTRSGKAEFPPRLPHRADLPRPEPFQPGLWPVVFAEADVGLGMETPRTEWFPIAEEAARRAVLAQRVLEEATAIRGAPEFALASIRAAGALMTVDLDKTVADLLAEAAPGESLIEAYERRPRKA